MKKKPKQNNLPFLIGQMTVQIIVSIWIYELIFIVSASTWNATRFEKRIGQVIE